MIKKLSIKNFQAHEHKELELSNGINLIVGSGDVGKSSIIRGLRWNLFNSISGDKFIRRGSTKANVSVDMGSGSSIVRERGKSKNRYVLNGEEFKAFGQGPVPEILQAHKIREDISFQGQHDGAFLLSWGTGETTKFLNGLIDLELMSDTLRELNLQYRRTNQAKENAEKELADVRSVVEELAFVPDALSDIETIQKQVGEMNTHLGILEDIACVVKEYDCASEKLLNYQWVNEASLRLELINQQNKAMGVLENEISALKGTVVLYDKSVNDVASMEWTHTASVELNKIIKEEMRLEVDYELITRLHTTQKTIKKTEKHLKYLSNAESMLVDIVEYGEALEKIDGDMIRIKSILGTIQKREDVLTNHKVLYEDLIEYGVDLFEGYCPTCGTKGFDPIKEMSQ